MFFLHFPRKQNFGAISDKIRFGKYAKKKATKQKCIFCYILVFSNAMAGFCRSGFWFYSIILSYKTALTDLVVNFNELGQVETCSVLPTYEKHFLQYFNRRSFAILKIIFGGWQRKLGKGQISKICNMLQCHIFCRTILKACLRVSQVFGGDSYVAWQLIL